MAVLNAISFIKLIICHLNRGLNCGMQGKAEDPFRLGKVRPWLLVFENIVQHRFKAQDFFLFYLLEFCVICRYLGRDIMFFYLISLHSWYHITSWHIVLKYRKCGIRYISMNIK